MNARRQLQRLVDRLADAARLVRERIRDAVAAEIGQAVGTTAHGLLHDLLRGPGPRARPDQHRDDDPDARRGDGDPADPERAESDRGDAGYSRDADRHAADDRNPEWERPPIDPPPRLPTWLAVGLGLAAVLATAWSGPVATAGALGSAADWFALARWALGHSPF